MSTIITRAGKGSPLTNDEVDANFNNLNSTKLETSAVGTLSSQNANGVAITGGAISGTTVGATTVAAGSFSTLNSSGNTRLGGLSGNQSLQVNNVASAVNYAQIVGAVTGGSPTYSAQGTDANIDLTYSAKGTGNHYFRNQSGVTAFLAAASASAVDYFYTSAGIGFPFFSVAGASANIGFTMASKGTGSFFFKTGASETQFRVNATASAVNYLSSTGAVTTGAPELSAQGSDANINLKLTPKGTGVLQFGTYTATVLSPTGFITITDAGGTSRRLLVG